MMNGGKRYARAADFHVTELKTKMIYSGDFVDSALLHYCKRAPTGELHTSISAPT